MSSGRNRDDCPECGYRKPGHKVRCRFGAALVEGAAQAERELMSPQMRALRGVVAEQVYQPVVPTGQGFADLVDRITRAVAEHVGAVPMTPEVEAAAREGWESHGPQGVAVASGCPGCGAVPEQTKHGRVTLHTETCPRAAPRVPGPPTASGPQDPVPVVQDPLSQLTCPVRYCGTDGGPSSHRATLHDPHLWGQNQNAYRCPGADVPGPPAASRRYGECPQTERHTAHQWTGGVGDEVRYWCDGEPSADGS